MLTASDDGVKLAATDGEMGLREALEAEVSGTGSVHGAVAVRNGGHFSPSSLTSFGTMSVTGGVTMDAGSVYDYDAAGKSSFGLTDLVSAPSITLAKRMDVAFMVEAPDPRD